MKNKNIFIFILVIFIFIVTSFCLYIQYIIFQPLTIKKEKIFILPLGSNYKNIRKLLYQQNLVQCIHYVPIWSILLSIQFTKIQAGAYRLQPGMTIYDLLQLLTSGKEAQFSIRFIEGSTLKDWLHILDQAPYLKHDLNNYTLDTFKTKIGNNTLKTLEGQFYPDTYLYTYNTCESEILVRAYKRMKQILEYIWNNRDKNLPYKTPQELLIMASIIEKETGKIEEKARIASVFINRLRINMRLQSDATVLYSNIEKKTYKNNIIKIHNMYSTLNNTYTILGLPNTPISMPGITSLKAAAHPEKSIYFYFVSNGSGRHIFTNNFLSHKKEVIRYRKTQKKRSS